MQVRFIQYAIIPILAILISLVAPETASSRVIIHKKEKFYRVHGKTGAQIYKNILKFGTKAGNYTHAIASTQVNFELKNLKGHLTSRTCKVDNVDIVVSIIYTYPKWVDRRRATPKVRKDWDRFMLYLRKHERHHGEIAIKTAKKYERVFKRSRGSVARKCEDWSNSVERKIGPLIARYHRQQAQYDRREHGRYGRIRRAQIALINGK